MASALILAGARTPFATWAGGTKGDGQKGGMLKEKDPFDLGAEALKGALKNAAIPGEALDRVVFGIMYAVGPHACYGARYVSLRAGVPDSVPAVSVSLACGTGLYAFLHAAQEITSGNSSVLAVGGSDVASLVRRDVFIPSFKDAACGLHIALTSQTMATEHGISRAEQDRWAQQSHQRALRARESGIFAEEIVPVGAVLSDDNILEAPSLEHFASSESLFDAGASATRANTHGIADGASALIMASEEAANRLGARDVLGRYVAGAVIGLPPQRMAYSSVLAIRKALAAANMVVSDIDLFEINETFAAQTLIGLKELGIPEDKVNVNGGALALGHAFAGTGCRLILTLLKELGRRGQRRGLASICIGAGQGVAAIVERS